MREIIIGTRKSNLALIQTNKVINELKRAGVTNPIKIREFNTKGDQNLTMALSKVGGKGIFIKEIERAIYNEEIDCAVHSMKDLPTLIPEELTIASFPAREDHRDAYISNNNVLLKDLPVGAVVGTSSLRRSAQLLAARPDIKTKWIRGPVDSRLQQLEGNSFDAIILAVAGLKRLGLGEEVITEYLRADTFVPAIGQGALAIECRINDGELKRILGTINDEETALAIEAEREFVYLLDENNQAPIGGYAEVKDGQITLHGMVLSSNGQQVLHEVVHGSDPHVVAKEVATNLIDQGAQEIIHAVAKELGK